MAANSKTPWPTTYLGRLEAVTTELKRFDQPTSVEMLLERFSGVTADQVEAILTALVLFGRVDRRGGLFSVPKDSEKSR